MADKKKWVVNGFQFGTENDAETAKNEKLRIEKLEEKIDYNDSEMLYALYNKAIENRVFKTPVGYEFLKKIQNRLIELNYTKSISDIPVYGVYSVRDSVVAATNKVKPSEKKTKHKIPKQKLGKRLSIYLNVILTLLIIVMFYISYTGSNPTVLNYEKAIQNRYAEWEDELTEREAVIREKEKELLIE